MQMRALGAASVAAVSNKFSLVHREKRRRQFEIDLPRPVTILLFVNISGKRGKEVVEMAIDRSIAIGMIDVDSLAEPKGCNGHARYIAIGGSEHGKIFAVLCPDVQTHVIVLGTQLAEVGGQVHGNGQRIAEIITRIGSGHE